MLRILKGNLLMIIISDLEDLNIKKLKNIKFFLNIPFIRTRFKSEQKPLEFYFILNTSINVYNISFTFENQKKIIYMSNYKIISPGCVTIQDRNENLPTTTVYTIY